MSSGGAKLAKTEQLFDAIKSRSYCIAKKLLQEGANPNLLLLNGVTPLHLAIAGESTFSYSYVKLLLDFKGNPNVCDADGITPLHVAAQWDKADCFSLLLENGADLSLIDKDGNDIRWHAQDSKHCKIIIEEYMKTTEEESYNIGSTSSSCLNYTSKRFNSYIPAPFQELNGNKNHHDFLSDNAVQSNLLKLTHVPVISTQENVVKKKNNTEKENLVFLQQSVSKLSLDATSPDHCFFVCKSKNEIKCENLQETVLVSSVDNQILPRNNILSFDDSSSSLDKTTEITQIIVNSSLDNSVSNHSVDMQRKLTDEKNSQSSGQSSICTFSDSTLPIEDIELDLDQTSSVSDFNLLLSSASTDEDSQSNTVHDSYCRKMLLGTKRSANDSAERSTPKTSVSCHSPKRLVFENINVTPDSENCKSKNDFLTTQTQDNNSLIVGQSSCTFFNSTSVESNGSLDKDKNQQINDSEVTKLQTISETTSEPSCSEDMLKESHNAFNSLTLSDASESSLPLKLFLSTSSIENDADNTIIYDWKGLVGCDSLEEIDCSYIETISLPPRIENMDDKQLRSELMKHGILPGPITGGRKQYKKQLYLLEQGRKSSTVTVPSFSRELESIFRGNSLPPSVVNDDLALRNEFDDPSQSTRGGYAKDSFNYLLLDPRITKNLPERSKFLSESEALKIFAGATFYVGKGKKSRPYAHLKEALRNTKKAKSRKIEHIHEIWKTDGVVSLHVFQNVLACEAFTREAAMIEAFGLSHLTNCVRSKSYGSAQSWDPVRLRQYGTFLIIRAMQMLLLEGERQIRPHQISNKQKRKK